MGFHTRSSIHLAIFSLSFLSPSFFSFDFFFLFNDYWKLIRSYDVKLGLACFLELTIASAPPQLIQNIHLF